MVRRMGTSRHPFARFVTAIVALIALGTCPSFAQTSTATIFGVVRDASGALVPGVMVTVKHTESGLTRDVISSENGGYSVPLLPVGPYEITTTMPDFTGSTSRDQSRGRPGSCGGLDLGSGWHR